MQFSGVVSAFTSFFGMDSFTNFVKSRIATIGQKTLTQGIPTQGRTLAANPTQSWREIDDDIQALRQKILGLPAKEAQECTLLLNRLQTNIRSLQGAENLPKAPPAPPKAPPPPKSRAKGEKSKASLSKLAQKAQARTPAPTLEQIEAKRSSLQKPSAKIDPRREDHNAEDAAINQRFQRVKRSKASK